MSDYKNFIERRDFLGLRNEIDKLSAADYRDALFKNGGAEVFRQAVISKDEEAICALLHNPYRNQQDNLSEHEKEEKKEFGNALSELVARSGQVMSEILNMRLGTNNTPMIDSIRKAQDWDEKVYAMTDQKIEELLTDAEIEEEEVKELANLLIGRMNRGFELPSHIWDRVFPQMPSILEKEHGALRVTPPDNLWMGVFLEMACQDNQAVVEQMLYSLSEDVRKNFLSSAAFSHVIAEAEAYDGSQVPPFLYNERLKSGVIPVSDDPSVMFYNCLIYDDQNNIAEYIENMPLDQFRSQLLSEEGKEAFAYVMSGQDQKRDFLADKVLNKLDSDHDRLELLQTETEKGVPFIVVAEERGGKSVMKIMLNSLDSESQQELILSEEGKCAFGWVIQNDDSAAAQLMLSKTKTIEKERELVNTLQDEILLRKLSGMQLTCRVSIGGANSGFANGEPFPWVSDEEVPRTNPFLSEEPEVKRARYFQDDGRS